MLSIGWRKKSSRVVENHSKEISFKYEAAGSSCSSNNQYSYSLLEYCNLCHKSLRYRDIYMYRGEMGFCSEECRSRQMYLDDMKKIEISTRRILASFHERRRHGQGRCETATGGINAAAPPIFISK